MKYIIRLSIVIGLIFNSIILFGQQQAMYTQYMFNHVAVNPAYAVSMQNPTAMLLARQQWVGFDGAPTSQTLTFHGPLKEEKIGIGLSVLNDKIGPINETGVSADYAYQIKLTEGYYLAMGLKGSLSFYKANYTKLRTIQLDDPRFNSDITQNFIPNWGAGMFFYTNDYYIGFSCPKVMQTAINNNSTSTTMNSKESRHYFLIGGYVFNISDNLKFKPSVLTKIMPGTPIAPDFTASFLLRDRLWLGATYSFKNAFCAMVEFRLSESLLIGYSIDFATTKIIKFNSGTHEVLLSYELKSSKARLKSPRYF